MKHSFLLLGLFLVLFSCSKKDEQHNINKADFETLFEKSDGTKTPRYDETIEYCQKLADNFNSISFSSFGTLPSGREVPILIYDKDGFNTPNQTKKSEKVSILITACIHPGEPCGKDAGMMLMRDLAFGDCGNIAENTTVLFVPILCPDGHEFFRAHNRINQKKVQIVAAGVSMLAI